MCAVGVFIICICLVNFTYLNLEFPWTSVRLAPTFAFWKGYPLYSTLTEPPWVMVGYGPIYPLMYTPSLFASSTGPAVAIATTLSHIFILMPLYLLTRLASADQKNPRQHATIATFLIYLLFLSIDSLYYVTMWIAADAPAFGFLLLAAWFLLRCSLDSRFNVLRGACLAGVFIGLSVATKINLAPAALTFTVWCFWFCGLRATVGLLACTVASVAGAYGLACINSDPQAILLSLKVLNNYPWGIYGINKPFETTAEKAFIFVMQLNLIVSQHVPVVLAMILLLQPFARGVVERRLPSKAAPALAIFFLVLALNMLAPVGVTLSKWGGGVNSLALFTLPLTLSAVFAVMHYARDVLCVSNRFLFVLSLPWVLVSLIHSVEPWKVNKNFRSMSDTVLLESYRLVEECKGTCYLPFDPLAHIYIEGVFRPNLDVIQSFVLGGTHVDQQAFSAALPDKLEKIYLPNTVASWGIDELKRLTNFHPSDELRSNHRQNVKKINLKFFIVLTPNRSADDSAK